MVNCAQNRFFQTGVLNSFGLIRISPVASSLKFKQVFDQGANFKPGMMKLNQPP